MTFQLGVILQNAQLNVWNTTIGNAGTLSIFSGAEPVNCAAPDPTGLLATIALPTIPFQAAVGGLFDLNGIWSTATPLAAGTAASFRVYDSGGNCMMQGNTSTDLVLNPPQIVLGKPVTVTVFRIIFGNS